LPVGQWFVFITLLSEALLLFVAAQAGFIDGPRVMANMAHDSWFPHRFSALSDRLTMQNGVLLMGGAGFRMLLHTRGEVDALGGPCSWSRPDDTCVSLRLTRLDQIQEALPRGPPPAHAVDRKKPAAVLLVGSYSGLGIHSLLTVVKLFPRYFASVVFMTVGVVDSATFQGVEEVDRVREQAEEDLKKYVDQARRMGLPADYRVGMGTEAVAGCVRLAEE